MKPLCDLLGHTKTIWSYKIVLIYAKREISSERLILKISKALQGLRLQDRVKAYVSLLLAFKSITSSNLTVITEASHMHMVIY